MIKLSEIVNTNRTVSISDKGIEEVGRFNQLYDLLKHFQIPPEKVYEYNSTFFHLVSNLQIWMDENILKPGEKVPLLILFQRMKKLGAFTESDELEEYLKDMVNAGLINY